MSRIIQANSISVKESENHEKKKGMVSTMNITEKIEGASGTLLIEGRLDTTTAPALESKIKSMEGSIQNLILDFTSLEYVSSAGLRVLLGAQKYLNSIKGSMVIRNVNKDIMEVLELTGFVDILTIE